MKQIGRGAFTTAYRKPNGRVLLKSVDPVKECMSNGWFPNSHFFPKIKRVEWQVYEMRFYEKKALKKYLKPNHYQWYLMLRNIWKNNLYVSNGYAWYQVFEKSNLPKHLKQALLDAIYALLNYGEDIQFEISPRNVRVSDTGGLVLMDCFFLRQTLEKVRHSKRRY